MIELQIHDKGRQHRIETCSNTVNNAVTKYNAQITGAYQVRLTQYDHKV